jgi:hypothetical protein
MAGEITRGRRDGHAGRRGLPHQRNPSFFILHSSFCTAGLSGDVGKEGAYDVQGGGSVSLPRQYRGTTDGGSGGDGIAQMANGRRRGLGEGTQGGTGANCGTAVKRGRISRQGRASKQRLNWLKVKGAVGEQRAGWSEWPIRQVFAIPPANLGLINPVSAKRLVFGPTRPPKPVPLPSVASP